MDFLHGDLRISDIAFTWSASDYEEKTVFRDKKYDCLAICLGGKSKYVFEQYGERIVQKNDVIYLPKHSSYTVMSLEREKCYAINFELVEEHHFAPFILNVKNASAFAERFRTADRIFSQKKTGYRIKCLSELYAIIYDLIKLYEKEYLPDSKVKKIMPAIDYIHNHYTDPATGVEGIVRLCGLSPAYFREIFTKHYGVSPIQYINNLRIIRAKELLRSGMYAVSRIAELSGFGDESYFCRYFKKTVGMTPTEYRQQ